MHNVTMSMNVSLDGTSPTRTAASTGGRLGTTSFVSPSRRHARSASTSWGDGCTRRCCTGRPPTRTRSMTPVASGRRLESAPEGRVLHHALVGAGHGPTGLRRPDGGGRAVASRARRQRHRDRRRDARRGGGSVGPDRRVPDRDHPVLLGGGIRTFPSANVGLISNSSRPAPSVRRSSTSAIAWSDSHAHVTPVRYTRWAPLGQGASPSGATYSGSRSLSGH